MILLSSNLPKNICDAVHERIPNNIYPISLPNRNCPICKKLNLTLFPSASKYGTSTGEQYAKQTVPLARPKKNPLPVIDVPLKIKIKIEIKTRNKREAMFSSIAATTSQLLTFYLYSSPKLLKS